MHLWEPIGIRLHFVIFSGVKIKSPATRVLCTVQIMAQGWNRESRDGHLKHTKS